MNNICDKHHTPARNNPQKHTIRYYDTACPYCRIELRDSDIDRLSAEVERLKTSLSGRTYFHSDEAVESDCRTMADMILQLADMVAEWSPYASEYFQQKYDLQGDLNRCEEFRQTARKYTGEEGDNERN